MSVRTRELPVPAVKKVDETLTAVPGHWEFDAEVAQHFDSHVRKSVPLYEEAQALCVDVSEWFVHDNSVIYDLGCASGETLVRMVERHANKANIRIVGIDESAPMLERARQKLSAQSVTLRQETLSTESRFDGADYVLALYTLQFVPLASRVQILHNIYRDLNSGGAFFWVEKCLAESAYVQEIWSGTYYDFKARNGFSEEEIIGKNLSLRGVLTPITASENIAALRGAGFEVVDRLIHWGPFVGFLAVKNRLDGGRAEGGRGPESDGLAFS